MRVGVAKTASHNTVLWLSVEEGHGAIRADSTTHLVDRTFFCCFLLYYSACIFLENLKNYRS